MGNQYNMNAGYGKLTQAVPFAGGGQIFVVAKSSQAARQILQDLFNVDPDGKNRYGSTLNTVAGYGTASRGDIIYVAPGHTETISSSTALTLSTAGITVIGLGQGGLRPTFTLDTATTATVNVTAANITIQNCVFVANFADITSAFTLTAASDFALLDCEFRDTSSILNFVNIIDTNATTNAADGLRMERCKRIGAGATNNTTIIKMDGTNDRLTVKDCYFAHNSTTDGGLFMVIAAGKVVTNALIENNTMNFVGTAAGTAGIIITTNGSTNSGIIRRNAIKSLDATTEILVTASSGFIFDQNYYAGAADKSGYLLPAADA